MDNNKPLVSVILSTYNRPYFLTKAIKSVVDQSYENWELIVVNDAGQDVEFLVEAFDDERIKYINHETNKGLGGARNTGIQMAKGKYVNFLDDDDFFFFNHLETLVSFMEKNNYQVAYTDAVCHIMQKDNAGNYQVVQRAIPYSFDYNPDMLLFQNITPVLCVMFELNDITRNIKLDETARVYEDWLFWLELTKHYPMYHLALPTCVYTFRQDGSTMSSSRNEFTTMLPDIYKNNYSRAMNMLQVCKTMNAILKQRGLEEIFKFTDKDGNEVS